MSSVKESVVLESTEPGTAEWRSLLAKKQYKQMTACLNRAYTKAVETGEMEQAALLTVAGQLSESCARIQEEIAFHQEAYQQTASRQENLQMELKKVLGMIEPDLTPAPLSSRFTFWQRVSQLWQRHDPPPARPSGLAPPGSQNWLLPPGDTAVSPPPPADPATTATPAPAFGQQDSLYPQLTIYCLGAFRVYEDEHPVEEWPSRKGKTIFKYLLLHRQRRITKDVLMAEFWPEATADAARNNLNVAIYGLRQALRNGYPDFSHVLFQDDSYFLNPDMEIWVDVEQFEVIYARLQQKMQQGVTAVALPDLHAAELLYQGDLFAEDPYEDWPEARRRRLKRQYLQLLTYLCNYYFDTEQYATCITFANKLLRQEPCHEATHRLLMRAFVRQQQEYLALRQYYQCVECLEKELAVLPGPATTELYEAIRSHQPV